MLSSGVPRVSSTVVLSRAFLHEHFLFFTCLSYHTTRTLSTSRTSPRSPGKLRHQDSLWREDLQSGGNACATTPTPSNSRCSLMCSSGKSLTKTRFTSLISKCSSGSAASLLCQARIAHQHPAWHIVNRQQVARIVMESLDALLKPRDAVRDTLAPFSLELVRGDEHLETFTLFLCGRCCPSSAPTVSVSLRSPSSGMFLAAGDSSRTVIAKPTRRAAPFKPPTSRVATDQLTSRFSLVLYKRTSCWKSRQPLGWPPHCGRFIRSFWCSVICETCTQAAELYCRLRSSLRSDSCFSASFAVNVAGILRRLLNHCGTRVCSVSRSNKCATHVLRTQDPKAVWSRRVQTTQSLVGQHA